MTGSVMKRREDLAAIFAIYEEGIQFFEQGKIVAARGAFHSSFVGMNGLLRQIVQHRESFYYRGSPVSSHSSYTPMFRRVPSPLHQQQSYPSCPTPLEGKRKKLSLSPSSSSSPANMAVMMQELTMPTTTCASSSSCGHEDEQGDPVFFAQILDLPRNVTVNQFIFCSIYNFAVSTHLSAMMCGDDTADNVAMRSMLLGKSVHLWDLVYPLQWKQGLNLKPCHGLAILLNMGHCKRLVGSTREAEHCFRNIISAVSILESRQQEVPDKSFFMFQAFINLNNPHGSVAITTPAA